MTTSDGQAPGAPTISVATMNETSIDLDLRAGVLPRQGAHPEPDRQD